MIDRLKFIFDNVLYGIMKLCSILVILMLMVTFIIFAPFVIILWVLTGINLWEIADKLISKLEDKYNL